MNFDLGKVVGTATATVALIIASSIFLQNLSTKYMALTGRLSELTDEMRRGGSTPTRTRSLHEQVRTTEQRCQLVRLGSAYLEAAVLTFIVTVLTAGLSTALPSLLSAKWIGGGSLVLGLGLLFVSVLYELRENHLAKSLLRSEIADLAVSPTPLD